MKCADARFALAADPASRDSALAAHLTQCPACAAYADDMRELDRRLRAAMAVPVPAGKLPSGPYAVTSSSGPAGGGLAGRPLTRRFALAASVAGVAVLAGLLWAGFPRQSLASSVVAHMAEEPDAWGTTVALPEAEIASVISRSGVRLDGSLPEITYAHSCWFRGHFVPHLVVQTADGPVTILVLPEETVSSRVGFREGGYQGTLVPAGRGSIAVLARSAADVDAVASRALAAIAYTK